MPGNALYTRLRDGYSSFEIHEDDLLMDETRKNPNPLLAEFQDSSDLGLSLTDFDWQMHGVHIPYVVFITGRCGSTLLSNMIKDTQLAGVPDEYFNEGFIASYNKKFAAATFEAYFSATVDGFSSNWRFGFEIDWYRLRHFEKIVDFANIFPSNRSIFFYMTRRDILAQAWSYATAKATGVWHQFADSPDASAPQTQPILDDESVWREIILLLEAEMQMESFFHRYSISPIRTDYEMLISNKRSVLGLVLSNIGCSVESIVENTGHVTDRTSKMPNDNFAEMLSFQRKYAGLLADVQKARGSNYDVIRQKLREKYSLLK